MATASPKSPRSALRRAALAAVATSAALAAMPVAASGAVLSLGDVAAPVTGLISPRTAEAPSATTTAPAPLTVSAAGVRLDLGLGVAQPDGPLLAVDLGVGATVPGVADVQVGVDAQVDTAPGSVLPTVGASTAVTVGAGPGAGAPSAPGPAPTAPARPRPATPAPAPRDAAPARPEASAPAPPAVAPVTTPAPARTAPGGRAAAPRREAPVPAVAPVTSGRAPVAAAPAAAVAGRPRTAVGSRIDSEQPAVSAPRRAAAAIGEAVRAASTSPWLPVGVLAAIALYLLGQRALDRGSKLAYAGRPGAPDDELIEL